MSTTSQVGALMVRPLAGKKVVGGMYGFGNTEHRLSHEALTALGTVELTIPPSPRGQTRSSRVKRFGITLLTRYVML